MYSLVYCSKYRSGIPSTYACTVVLQCCKFSNERQGEESYGYVYRLPNVVLYYPDRVVSYRVNILHESHHRDLQVLCPCPWFNPTYKKSRVHAGVSFALSMTRGDSIFSSGRFPSPSTTVQYNVVPDRVSTSTVHNLFFSSFQYCLRLLWLQTKLI